MKKLLLLGGLRYLVPVIKTAHELGYYVITCDYLPNNIAHRYSDEYFNISITDQDAVLELSRKLKIDGIMSFAVDPGVLTTAYVAEKLGLPGCPYESVKILQNKGLFREFLRKNGFNVPLAKACCNYNEALEVIGQFKFPIIVKPVDSAGSKGVTKVNTVDSLMNAVELALKNSLSDHQFIIEEFIEKDGFSSDTDSFSINNELKFVTFSSQYFDSAAANPYTPSAYSWPSLIENRFQKELTIELQRLVKLLDLGTSIYNIETRVGIDQKAYIMELSPRGGGNRLAEMLKFATGIDLIKMAVKSAVGERVEDLSIPIYDSYWTEIILHSNKDGLFEKLDVDLVLMTEHIKEIDLWVEKGDKVRAFRAANDSIGTIIARFDSQNEMVEFINNHNKRIKIFVN